MSGKGQDASRYADVYESWKQCPEKLAAAFAGVLLEMGFPSISSAA